ncbi:hypothetical protein NDU88_004752 [Pleurodeles waltl]|uniref:Uncharacterized protein n=1 Tax=Pleurodeles waltl TaxID=8319 RepID=A0AAV7W5V7_PLEWA|nr:hypothetical protein NDU88_004752 [Pleurodeles waltl]
MVSLSRGGTRSLSAGRSALVRSVCLSREHAMSAVLRVGVSKAALARKCFLSEVELQPPLCLSAHSTSAQSSQEDQERPGPSYLVGTRVGTESMVSSAIEHGPRSSTQTTSSGGSSVAAAGDGSPPKSVQSPPACVDIEQRQLMAFDLPPEVCHVILIARRPST